MNGDESQTGCPIPEKPDDLIALYRAGIERRVKEQLIHHLEVHPNTDRRRIVELQIRHEREKLERLLEKYDDLTGSDAALAAALRVLMLDWLPELELKLKRDFMWMSDLEEQDRLNEELAGSKSPLAEPKNQAPDFVRRLLILAAIIVALGLIYGGAYMVRYEVILIPQQDYQSIVQYLVKDRWTGNIEVVWQDSKGQVLQTKRHFFDSSQEQNQ